MSSARTRLIAHPITASLRAGRGEGIDRYLTPEEIARLAPLMQHRPGAVAVEYVHLLQAGLSRAEALGWLHAHGGAIYAMGPDARQVWADEQASRPWRRVGWLMHAAGITDPIEQERVLTEGVDRDMLLAMAALRGHDLPEIIARPTPKRPKRRAAGTPTT